MGAEIRGRGFRPSSKKRRNWLYDLKLHPSTKGWTCALSRRVGVFLSAGTRGSHSPSFRKRTPRITRLVQVLAAFLRSGCLKLRSLLEVLSLVLSGLVATSAPWPVALRCLEQKPREGNSVGLCSDFSLFGGSGRDRPTRGLFRSLAHEQIPA